MKAAAIGQFVLLLSLCMVIYLPTIYIYETTDADVRFLHTSITFIISFIACCLVGYMFIDKEEEPIQKPSLPRPSVASAKSAYINNLSRVTIQQKGNEGVTASNMTVTQIEVRIKLLQKEVKEKENELQYESNPEIQGAIQNIIEQLQDRIDNLKVALRMKKDMEANRVFNKSVNTGRVKASN